VDARREHWETVYATKSPDEVSWYQRSPDVSLAMIRGAGLTAESGIVDVGGGASTLVDHLLAEGCRRVAVVDIAARALERSKQRLGAAAPRVDWIVADVTQWRPAAPFDIWHDRAVFHFLTEDEDRRGYLNALNAGLRVGGDVVIGAFALDGPERCSGLPVRRYSPPLLADTLGDGFSLVASCAEDHRTPAGTVQRFVYARFRRVR